MVEWFNKAMDWIMTHYEEIVTFVTSAQFAMIATLVGLLVNQIKKVAKNTASTQELQLKIADLEAARLKMNIMSEQMTELRKQNDELKAELSTMKKQLGLFFEAQSIVYSTHRNEHTRSNLMRLVTKAKTLNGDESILEDVSNVIDVKKIVKSKAKNAVKAVIDTASTEPVESTAQIVEETPRY